ncbi:3,4-dihydroxy-2-butanone-4-phosphate synthase [Amorphus orientalis]|uniref:3,4-dihydroxy-2-butanone 4-phosphate synthase n=1 Tax=Amorphus orientalis TaxID=649198 RepID=A0AAE4ARX7_9HYPH|nr:3,4-dihydroxy-2-butanone-4-phosphate synthase [Amorphus orientalis]MDQ0314355.1 3,4-dihydroxy 2-butanone 4-phosphate synthase/GTP cyclohydrolase II [Amorphus orientalis]
MTEEASRVADAIRAFERGEIVVVTDDNDRENEGDLIVAANHATPEKLAFIVRHTSGIVCAPMTRADAERLNLAPMVSDNNAPLSTAFTVSVDVRHGLTTGISAEERCNTVRALANPNSGGGDFVRPGHVFPLIARDGGVLMRSGHTEAAVDLCKLAGLPPVGVICELVNDDGTVKRGDQVTGFADEHGLKTVSVADLIAWRQRTERLVERAGEAIIQTPIGEAQAVSYRTRFDTVQHLALIFGDIRDGESIPARLQREALPEDVFGKDRPIERILERIDEAKRGVVVYLRDGSAGVAPSSERARNALGLDEEHDTARQREDEWREIGLGAQILRDLGVSSIRLLASKERHYVGLGGFGISINSTEILDDSGG